LVRDGNTVRLEDILERIVGDDNVSSRSFIFHKHVYKLPALRVHTEIVDGETLITNEAAFIDALKRMEYTGRITTPSLRAGIKCL
jgi:hypothetical protein